MKLLAFVLLAAGCVTPAPSSPVRADECCPRCREDSRAPCIEPEDWDAGVRCNYHQRRRITGPDCPTWSDGIRCISLAQVPLIGTDAGADCERWFGDGYDDTMRRCFTATEAPAGFWPPMSTCADGSVVRDADLCERTK